MAFYSPLRYPGGKTFLSSFFQEVIEKNNLQNVTYIEPFAGGAGAALSLLFLGKVKKIVINDLDNAIYSFWKSAIFNSNKFIKKISSTPVTIREWKKQKAIYESTKPNQFELGFATFFLNRTNRSGILNGGPIGGLDQTGNWKIDARFNKDDLIARIKMLSSYKKNISVFRIDGIELAKSYLNKRNTFIYLDPPYYAKGASLYLNHYKNADHQKLADCLNKNRKAFWLLTYDNTRPIRRLYKKREIVNFTLNYNVHSARVGKEILVVSDTVKCKQLAI